MFKKLFLVFLMVLLYSKTAMAQNHLNLHRFELDDDYNEFWVSSRVIFNDDFSLQQQADHLFKLFFARADTYYFIPAGVKVLNTEISNGALYLNVSGEISSYAGSYTERRLIAQIIKTALNIPSVNNVTLLIEGKEEVLPEGMIIKDDYQWPDEWPVH